MSVYSTLLAEGGSVNVVSIYESLEMFQSLGIFITNQKEEEFLHLAFTIHRQKPKDKWCYTGGVL